MSHSPYSELQSHLLATATGQRGRTHGRNTSRKTVGRELLDSTNYPPPRNWGLPPPAPSVTRTTRRDSRAAREEGQQHLFYRHGHRHQQFPQWAMYREWDQLPDRGGEWGVTSQLPPAASSPGQEGTGAFSDLLPAQGCHIPARGCPFPPPGAHTVSGTEGHPARGGEGRAVSLTPNRGHTVVTVLPPASSVSHRPGGQRTVKFSSLPTDKPTSGEPKTLRNL